MMCLMICRNVSRLFFPRSREKEVVAANRFHSVRFRPGVSTNSGLDANRLCCLLRLKSTVYKHVQCWNKARLWQRFFISFAYGKKVGVDAQWKAMEASCCPQRTLKNQRLRASAQPDRQRTKWWQDSSLCGWSRY